MSRPWRGQSLDKAVDRLDYALGKEVTDQEVKRKVDEAAKRWGVVPVPYICGRGRPPGITSQFSAVPFTCRTCHQEKPAGSRRTRDGRCWSCARSKRR